MMVVALVMWLGLDRVGSCWIGVGRLCVEFGRGCVGLSRSCWMFIIS